MKGVSELAQDGWPHCVESRLYWSERMLGVLRFWRLPQRLPLSVTSQGSLW